MVKKIGIFIIASTNLPKYSFLIKEYWIKHTKYINKYKSNIDIFFLFDINSNYQIFSEIKDNIIIDKTIKKDFSRSGITKKTLNAFELKKNTYDVYLRSDITTIHNIDKFDNYVQNNNISYSGGICWENALRENIQCYLGVNNSIKNLSELKNYPGNTFFGGSCIIFNNEEINNLIENKSIISNKVNDDIALGLMMSNYTILINMICQIDFNVDFTKNDINNILKNETTFIKIRGDKQEIKEKWLKLITFNEFKKIYGI